MKERKSKKFLIINNIMKPIVYSFHKYFKSYFYREYLYFRVQEHVAWTIFSRFNVEDNTSLQWGAGGGDKSCNHVVTCERVVVVVACTVH